MSNWADAVKLSRVMPSQGRGEVAGKVRYVVAVVEGKSTKSGPSTGQALDSYGGTEPTLGVVSSGAGGGVYSSMT